MLAFLALFAALIRVLPTHIYKSCLILFDGYHGTRKAFSLHTTACPSVVPAVAIHPARPRSDGTTDSLARPRRQADVAKSPVDLNTDEIELLFVQKERAKAKKSPSVSAVVAPTRSPCSLPRPPPLHTTHIHTHTVSHTHTHTRARARTRTRAGFQLKITAPVRTSHLQEDRDWATSVPVRSGLALLVVACRSRRPAAHRHPRLARTRTWRCSTPAVRTTAEYRSVSDSSLPPTLPPFVHSLRFA